MTGTTPHFQKGSENKIAFIFSCPGQCEEKECRPVAKTTGKNLETLMRILNEKLNTSDFSRNKVTITNSWSKIEYQAKTGRTEAKKREILDQKNLTRLYNEIEHVTKIIITSGINAKTVLSALTEKNMLNKIIKTSSAPHLGTRGINMKIKIDAEGSPIKPGDANATYKRLEKIAVDIISELH